MIKRTFLPGFKLWITSRGQGDVTGKTLFGDGKWMLLDEIHRTSSLKEACRRTGISYRKAWGELKKAEERFGRKLIEKHRGGKKGGETRLTVFGEKLAEAYGSFREEVSRNLLKIFNEKIKKVLEE